MNDETSSSFHTVTTTGIDWSGVNRGIHEPKEYKVVFKTGDGVTDARSVEAYEARVDDCGCLLFQDGYGRTTLCFNENAWVCFEQL